MTHKELQRLSKEIMDKRTKKKGKPLYDGSGMGTGANAGRGGCPPSERTSWRKGARRERL